MILFSVACGVLTSGRKTVFDQMMISGVLPEAIGPSDILRSLGARELFAPSGAQALKSVRQFVVSYCGYFDDILVKAQDAEFTRRWFSRSLWICRLASRLRRDLSTLL